MTLETFFEKFDQIADAPNAVAKMRELVLELAVRGKLVQQDPNDEPAHQVLERIDNVQKRPMRMIATGEAEIDSPTQVEPLFELPDGWEWVQFRRLPIQA